MAGQHRTKLKHLWPLLLLSVLLSTRWLLSDAFPGAVSTLWTQAASALLVFSALYLLAWKRGWRQPGEQAASGSLFAPVSAAAALCVPALVPYVAHRTISSSNWTLSLALTPTIIAMARSALDREGQNDLLQALGPCLCGLTGMLLLFPQPYFSDWQSWVTIVGVPLLTGLAASFTRSGTTFVLSGKQRGTLGPIALAAGFATFLFAGSALGTHQASARILASPVAVWDVLAFLLSLLVLFQLGPLAWSAQFFLVPLLELFEGLALLRPPLELHSLAGLMLVAIGGFYLLISPSGRAPSFTTLSLR